MKYGFDRSNCGLSLMSKLTQIINEQTRLTKIMNQLASWNIYKWHYKLKLADVIYYAVELTIQWHQYYDINDKCVYTYRSGNS